jgi:hypothetical protein
VPSGIWKIEAAAVFERFDTTNNQAAAKTKKRRQKLVMTNTTRDRMSSMWSVHGVMAMMCRSNHPITKEAPGEQFTVV